MKNNKIIWVLAIMLIAIGFFALSQTGCSSPSGGGGGGGGGFDINTLSVGLYLGSPESLTADSAPISGVTANDLAAAVTYVTNAANPDGAYTLLLSQDVSAGYQSLNRSNLQLTIIGIGKERTIQFTGVSSDRLFYLNNGESLTLGQNITLKGIPNSDTQLIRVENGSLIMLAGSKITGRTTTFRYGPVYLGGANASFTMKGGSITGNNTSSSATDASGGLYVDTSGTFTMTGGSITGNTKGTPPDAMDVVLNGATNTTKTGSKIGVSIPAGLANQPVYP